MYFQQSVMSWSTRTRGNVALTHIATKTQKYALRKNVMNCATFNRTGLPSNSASGATCQPPRKSVVATAPITYKLPHSAKKKNKNRMPLYSVT